MTTHDLLREALRLPPEARAALAAELIESLDGVAPPEDVEAAWTEEIRRRLAEVDAGAMKPIPWEKARESIMAAARGSGARAAPGRAGGGRGGRIGPQGTSTGAP